jgi:hypothetical protein
LRVPFKGQLSYGSRAIAQRDRVALLSQEGKVLEAAKSSDRAAKYQLIKRLEGKDEKYKSISKAKQAEYLEAKLEELADIRFKEYKSSKLTRLFITYSH